MVLRLNTGTDLLLKHPYVGNAGVDYYFKERSWGEYPGEKSKSLQQMNTELLSIIPVLPTTDIARDILWYKEKTGFEEYYSDTMYGIIYRENLTIHLQWHANSEEDPLPGSSVIRLHVKNIKALFDEFVQRGTITQDAFKCNTPWKTNEFGFFDPKPECNFYYGRHHLKVSGKTLMTAPWKADVSVT